MAEARYRADDDKFTLLAQATIEPYQVVQAPSGQAAFHDSAVAVATGAYTSNLRTRGKAEIEKTTSMVLLAGQEVYWDHSANKLHYAKVNDRDFFVGTVVEDATAAELTALVDLNKRQRFDIDVMRDAALTTIVGTQALDTMGLFARGGARRFILSATNEAQKIDMLSVDGFATGANTIAEILFRVPSDGAGTVVDVSLGVANGTHATDASSITERLFVHLDANATAINLESSDGTTTVAITDTTLDYVEGSAVANRVHVLMDLRDLTDIQVYVNGVLALGSTVFKLNAATGPLFLLAHVEKTASTDTYELALDALRCWHSEQ
jgi:hypothetical protein